MTQIMPSDVAEDHGIMDQLYDKLIKISIPVVIGEFGGGIKAEMYRIA